MNEVITVIDDTLVPHKAFEEAARRIEQCFSYARDAAREAVGIALVGESRTGKSRALEEFFHQHAPVRNDEGLSTPVLRATTPARPTVKGLAEVLLRKLGDPRADKGTEQNKANRIVTLMRASGTCMLMIDEFQHFYDKGSEKVMHDVANWLKNLVDETRVALVVAGLPYCQAVLDQNEQLAGRFLSPIHMPRFAWTDDGLREEFIAILGAFAEALEKHFDLPALDDEEMAFRCYCATGGLMGYLTKFLRQAVLNAQGEHKRSITLEDLERANQQAVWVKAGVVGIANPFATSFKAEPCVELIAKVNQIGAPVEPPVVSRRGRRADKPARVSASAVLVA